MRILDRFAAALLLGDHQWLNHSRTALTNLHTTVALEVLQAEYERAKEQAAIEEQNFSYPTVIPVDDEYYYQRMSAIYQSALQEFDKPFEQCRCPAVILYRYAKMSDEQRKELYAAIIEDATAREKAIAKKAAANSKPADYSQSFGGTAADTKNEKEAAAILRGESGNEEEDISALYPFLAHPTIDHSYDHQQLRRHGKWGKVLGGTGCYIYLHYLTKEVVSNRPEDFEEEVVAANGVGGADAVEEKDPANGLRRVDLDQLPLEVDRMVKEGKKTPLLVDTSKTGAVRAFYTYKGMLEDVSCLTIPFGKSGVKKEDVMERCRAKLVGAIKTGATFALYMGDVRIEHADFKTKLCKKDVFPKEVFQSSGAKLLQPDYEPKYKAIFREQDLEAGQAIARDGFRVVVITTVDPYELESALADCIPLGYMEPLYVNHPEG